MSQRAGPAGHRPCPRCRGTRRSPHVPPSSPATTRTPDNRLIKGYKKNGIKERKNEEYKRKKIVKKKKNI